MSRLKERYQSEVVPSLRERFDYKNVNEVPRVQKIVINMGVGEATGDSKALDAAMEELALITGQRPAVTRARKSVANFKLREGMAIGCKVTLRGQRMYEFLDKLISVSLPRIRDFRGLSPRSFDGRGNYSVGLKEQLIFPEISYDKISQTRGMDVVVVTSAKSDEEALELLRALGMPFRAA